MSEPDNFKALLAHVAADAGGRWRCHSLTEHLHAVAALAGEFARAFGARDLAEPAGRWHDLGKHSAAFQEYIRTASVFERANAHVEGRSGRVNHSSAGALHAVAKPAPKGKMLAQLIMSGHAGLYDRNRSGTRAFAGRRENRCELCPS
ncbi:MAG: CRISPR-associated endonuclease Cas3'' [Porticoccaceae bacterium]